jgi:hypothetical protein
VIPPNSYFLSVRLCHLVKYGQERRLTVVIFPIANLASQLKCCNPGPVNSTTRSEATVFRFSCCMIYRIVSLPPIPGGGVPTKRMLTLSGTLNHVSPVISGIVTSDTPRPIERQPKDPAEQACESEPMMSIPGWARDRKNSVCIIVYCFVRLILENGEKN